MRNIKHITPEHAYGIYATLKTNVIKIFRIHKMQINWNKIFLPNEKYISFTNASHTVLHISRTHTYSAWWFQMSALLSVSSWYRFTMASFTLCGTIHAIASMKHIFFLTLSQASLTINSPNHTIIQNKIKTKIKWLNKRHSELNTKCEPDVCVSGVLLI